MKIQRINISEALRYMGYGNAKKIDSITAGIIKECEAQIMTVVKPAYTYKIFDLEHTDNDIRVKGTKLLLEGNDIRTHLEDCEKAVFMGVTLSSAVDLYIRKQQLKGMIYALVADSMASALIEQACNMAEAEILEKLQGYYCTWRFSPGYGDLPITMQRDFLNIIDANRKIGLTVTDTSILLPRKSVTAIIGLSYKPIPKKRQGCAICNMNKVCQFRKRGEHCGI